MGLKNLFLADWWVIMWSCDYVIMWSYDPVIMLWSCAGGWSCDHVIMWSCDHVIMGWLLPTQCIEQAALPCVGGSSEDHLDSTAKPLSSPLVPQVDLHLPLQSAHPPVHWGARENRGRLRGGWEEGGETGGVRWRNRWGQVRVRILDYWGRGGEGHNPLMCRRRPLSWF